MIGDVENIGLLFALFVKFLFFHGSLGLVHLQPLPNKGFTDLFLTSCLPLLSI